MNQNTLRMVKEGLATDEDAEQSKLLRHWTSKHRPTLVQSGVLALSLMLDTRRAHQFALAIYLRPRPKFDRVERAYIVEHVNVVPIKSTDEDPNAIFSPMQYAQIRQVLSKPPESCLCAPGHTKIHETGLWIAAMVVIGTKVANFVPSGFCEGALSEMSPDIPWKDVPWKEGMITKLNEGIVS